MRSTLIASALAFVAGSIFWSVVSDRLDGQAVVASDAPGTMETSVASLSLSGSAGDHSLTGVQAIVRKELQAAFADSGIRNEILAALETFSSPKNNSGRQSPETTPNNYDMEVTQAQTYQESLAFLEHKLELGIWYAEDSKVLQDQLRHVSNEQRRDIMSQIVVAINRGQLRMDSYEALPFL